MNPIPDNATIGQCYEPAMKITDEAEAATYFAQLVDRQMRLGKVTRAAAEKIERQNLGYFAGYYDNATRERVERLFKCSHPVFGSIAEKGAPTPEEAFNMGVQWARKGRR
jgi:hypothetical protein